MRKFFIFLIAVILAGCYSNPVKLSETDIEDLPNYNYEKLPKKTISASGFILFDIIPLGMTGREKRARQAIIEQSGADDIINPAISSAFRWTPIGSVYTITITATPIKKGGMIDLTANP